MTKKKNRGFSIVELLVVVGMLGGVSLVVMNISKLSTKSSVKLQLDTDITLTTSEINGILSDPIKCLATLGTTAAPSSINGKFFTQGSGSAPATGYGNSKLNIVSYNLTTTGNDEILTILYGNKNFLKGESGPTSVSKKINLYVVGTPGAITKCRSLSTSSTDILSHGSGSDIYYSGGNFGIGTSSPAATLDVAGEMNVTGGVKIANMLEAIGGLKIGAVGADSSITCTGSGTTRYNSTSDKMEFCNKTGKWTTFGSGGVVTCADLGNCIACTKTITSCATASNCSTPALTVPSGVSSIGYTLTGGGGGGGSLGWDEFSTTGWSTLKNGADGATSSGNFSVTSGSTISVYVGGGGGGSGYWNSAIGCAGVHGSGGGAGGSGYMGGGGGGGVHTGGSATVGGGGGGSTAILLNNTLIGYAGGGNGGGINGGSGGGANGGAGGSGSLGSDGSSGSLQLGGNGGSTNSSGGTVAAGGNANSGGSGASAGQVAGGGGGYGGGGGGGGCTGNCSAGQSASAGGDGVTAEVGNKGGAAGAYGSCGKGGDGGGSATIGSGGVGGGNSASYPGSGGNGGSAILTYQATTCSM